ncbi:MAG: phosphoribosylaminoimidazolesuccinocarboxamide synthase [Candidatus Acidulodesulfobacterium sp.]
MKNVSEEKGFKKIYEGKAKILYVYGNDETKLVTYFKDDATAFNGQKKGTIMQKGEFNNAISSSLFKLLKSRGIESHFIEKLSEREMLVYHLKMLPVEFIVRNYTAGSLAKKMGVEEGVKLTSPVVEMCFKSDELGDPFINDTYIKAFDLGKPEEVEEAKKIALAVNEILKDFFDKNGLMLVDYKLEFGTLNGKVLLADEITPDTMRLWDKVTLEKVDKDRFRRDLGGVEEAYKRVYDITSSI